jgi:hypothetical protein
VRVDVDHTAEEIAQQTCTQGTRPFVNKEQQARRAKKGVRGNKVTLP